MPHLAWMWCGLCGSEPSMLLVAHVCLLFMHRNDKQESLTLIRLCCSWLSAHHVISPILSRQTISYTAGAGPSIAVCPDKTGKTSLSFMYISLHLKLIVADWCWLHFNSYLEKHTIQVMQQLNVINSNQNKHDTKNMSLINLSSALGSVSFSSLLLTGFHQGTGPVNNYGLAWILFLNHAINYNSAALTTKRNIGQSIYQTMSYLSSWKVLCFILFNNTWLSETWLLSENAGVFPVGRYDSHLMK